MAGPELLGRHGDSVRGGERGRRCLHDIGDAQQGRACVQQGMGMRATLQLPVIQAFSRELQVGMPTRGL